MLNYFSQSFSTSMVDDLQICAIPLTIYDAEIAKLIKKPEKKIISEITKVVVFCALKSQQNINTAINVKMIPTIKTKDEVNNSLIPFFFQLVLLSI